MTFIMTIFKCDCLGITALSSVLQKIKLPITQRIIVYVSFW